MSNGNDEQMNNVPDWQKRPRVMVTTDTIDKHVGNYVTVLGQVKSTESSSCIIFSPCLRKVVIKLINKQTYYS